MHFLKVYLSMLRNVYTLYLSELLFKHYYIIHLITITHLFFTSVLEPEPVLIWFSFADERQQGRCDSHKDEHMGQKHQLSQPHRFVSSIMASAPKRARGQQHSISCRCDFLTFQMMKWLKTLTANCRIVNSQHEVL